MKIFDEPQEYLDRILYYYNRSDSLHTYWLIDLDDDEWLDIDLDLEDQWEECMDIIGVFRVMVPQIPLREFLENPPVQPVDTLESSLVTAEAQRLLDLLAQNGFVVDFLSKVSDREIYRFITEELFEQDVDAVRNYSIRHHFLYEKFQEYANETEAEYWAEEFITAFFENFWEGVEFCLRENSMCDGQGNPIMADQVKQQMLDFHAKHAPILSFSAKTVDRKIEGDQADVKLSITWQSLCRPKPELATTTAYVTFKMKRHEHFGWNITKIAWPYWM